MKSVIKAIDNLPFLLKCILCLPMLDIVWSVYKICKSLDKGNIVGIILGVLTIIPGAFFIFIVDFITLLLNKNTVWWID